jgi:hypothetical protein
LQNQRHTLFESSRFKPVERVVSEEGAIFPPSGVDCEVASQDFLLPGPVRRLRRIPAGGGYPPVLWTWQRSRLPPPCMVFQHRCWRRRPDITLALPTVKRSGFQTILFHDMSLTCTELPRVVLFQWCTNSGDKNGDTPLDNVECAGSLDLRLRFSNLSTPPKPMSHTRLSRS